MQDVLFAVVARAAGAVRVRIAVFAALGLRRSRFVFLCTHEKKWQQKSYHTSQKVEASVVHSMDMETYPQTVQVESQERAVAGHAFVINTVSTVFINESHGHQHLMVGVVVDGDVYIASRTELLRQLGDGLHREVAVICLDVQETTD